VRIGDSNSDFLVPRLLVQNQNFKKKERIDPKTGLRFGPRIRNCPLAIVKIGPKIGFIRGLVLLFSKVLFYFIIFLIYHFLVGVGKKVGSRLEVLLKSKNSTTFVTIS
jgi:hypothetical protein